MKITKEILNQEGHAEDNNSLKTLFTKRAHAEGNFSPRAFFEEKRAQALSFDLIIAALILLLIIGASFSLYNTQKQLMQEQLSLQDMHLAGINATNTILSDQNCLRGGIVLEKNILTSTTITCFSNLDYNYLKDTLSVSKYEFKITITDTNNNILLSKGTTTTKRAVAIQRTASDTNNLRKINFVIYEK